jgi:hypothetical protein
MSSRTIEPLIINIPPFGECTLLALNNLPENFRTYEELRKYSNYFDLQEFPSLSLSQIQEIFKNLSYAIFGKGVDILTGITVLLSGTHESYTAIDVSNSNQTPVLCVTSMEFFLWTEVVRSVKGELSGGPVEMKLVEIPVLDHIQIAGEDIFYCLFLGSGA